MKAPLGISIIVCCYNSETRIEKTLRCLAIQEGLINQKEIILVDNNSTDNTKEKARKIWNELKNPYPLKIITQQNQGLSHARTKGVLDSKYSFGIFCDDDNLLTPNYCEIIFKNFVENHSLGVIGG